MCVGLPGKVVRIVDEEHGLVEAQIGQQVKQVSAAILTTGGEEVHEGDWLEIHSGFALAKLDEEDAEEMLEHIRRLDEASRAAFGEAAAASESGEAAGTDPGTAEGDEGGDGEG